MLAPLALVLSLLLQVSKAPQAVPPVAEATEALRGAIGGALEAGGLRFESLPPPKVTTSVRDPEWAQVRQDITLEGAPYDVCLDFVRKVREAPAKPEAIFVRLVPDLRQAPEHPEEGPLKHPWLLTVGFRAALGERASPATPCLDPFEMERSIRAVLEESGVSAVPSKVELRLDTRLGPAPPGARTLSAGLSTIEIIVPETADVFRIERAFRGEESLFDATVSATGGKVDYSVSVTLAPRRSVLEPLEATLPFTIVGPTAAPAPPPASDPLAVSAPPAVSAAPTDLAPPAADSAHEPAPSPAPSSEVAPRPMLRIFRLQAADPAEVAAILQAVFAPTGPTITSGRPVSRPGAGAAETRIVSDPRSRALIVRTARAEDLEAIETILKEIDVPVR